MCMKMFGNTWASLYRTLTALDWDKQFSIHDMVFPWLVYSGTQCAVISIYRSSDTVVEGPKYILSRYVDWDVHPYTSSP